MDFERFLEREEGSCWEFAWLLTVTLRHMGLAARFACGYRVLLADEQHNGSPPRFPDTVALHAWSEAYIPGAGWIGLDPSLGVFVTESHIPLACAPEPARVLPIVGDGVGDLEASPATRSESLRVRRLTPSSVSWPHTDTQWADIGALGRSLDKDLALQGLKPALGVSLSLVSGQDGFAPEWSTQAVGPSKRSLAESLSISLWKRLGPGGVPQLGQGEWFGGESLPRWRLGCFFRADGEPVWRNPERLGFGNAQGTGLSDHAEPAEPAEPAEQAQRLAASIARGLGSIRPGWSRRTRIRFTSSGARAPPRPPTSPRRRISAIPRAAAPSPSVCRARPARRPVTSCRFPGITPAPAGSAAPGVSVAAGSILRRAALPWATGCRWTA